MHPTAQDAGAHIGQLLHRWPTQESYPDGYPVAIHHLFAVYPSGEAGAPYPVRMMVETVTADSSSGPVLAALEADARRRLDDMFAITMEAAPGFA